MLSVVWLVVCNRTKLKVTSMSDVAIMVISMASWAMKSFVNGTIKQCNCGSQVCMHAICAIQLPLPTSDP